MGRSALIIGLAAALSSCNAPPDLQPDQVLRDSLGLTSRDRVHTVVLANRGGVETVVPPRLELRPGALADFRSGDGFLHEVRFPLDSLPPDARSWVERSNQLESPPLLSREARWVVDFEAAPPGRYPFVVEGNGLPGAGVVVVVESGRLDWLR